MKVRAWWPAERMTAGYPVWPAARSVKGQKRGRVMQGRRARSGSRCEAVMKFAETSRVKIARDRWLASRGPRDATAAES